MSIVVKNASASVVDGRDIDGRDMGSIPGLGKSPGEGNGNPLQHCLGILAWEIPWTEDPGGPQFTGSKI